jgi:ABC-type oligopeptide transport system ATPase subunit
VLVATHDRETVRKMQRRIISMERGRVLEDGSRSAQLPPEEARKTAQCGGEA